MMARYKLVQQDPETRLWRVQALVDIRPGVVRGDIGGWVEGEHNLTQDITSTAWVYGEAMVCGQAQVYGGARVSGQARIYGQAQVQGGARVWGEAQVYGGAQVYEDARVYGKALVCEKAQVFGQALVCGGAQVYQEARVSGQAQVFGEAQVYGKALVCGGAVWGEALVYGEAQISGQARVYGEALVHGQAHVQKVCIHLQQPRYSLTATDTHLIMGCQVHTWEAWLGRGFIAKLGREYGYSPPEIALTRKLIRALHQQCLGIVSAQQHQQP